MGGHKRKPGEKLSQSDENSPLQSDRKKSDTEIDSSSSGPEVGSDYCSKECKEASCTNQACFMVSTEAYIKGEKASSVYVTEAFERETIFVCRKHSKNKSINNKKVLEVAPWDSKEEEFGEEVGSAADLDEAFGGKPSPSSEIEVHTISSDKEFLLQLVVLVLMVWESQ